MDEVVLSELELNVKAKITHYRESDSVTVHVDMCGITTPDGLRKLVLECVAKLLEEYEKNRKDLFAKVSK